MNKVILYLIPILFLLIVILSIIYLGKRLSFAFGLPTTLISIIIGTLIFIFFGSLITIMQTNMTNTFSHILYNISTIGIGVFTILLFVTIGIDIIKLFIKMSPHLFGIIIIIATAFISCYAIYKAQHVIVYHLEIKIPNLDQEFKIAQLSDIHIGHFWGKKDIKKLVNIIEKEKLDAVVITGDLFDGRVRLNEDVLSPFKKIKIPIFFIEGNHDGYSGAKEIKELVSKNNIKVLDNEKAEVKGIQIIGLNYMLADKNGINTFNAPLSGKTIKETLPQIDIDKSHPSILLHHNPIGIEYVAENGINLYLAGHTHGGQMFPATIVTHFMYKYNKGLHRYNKNTQIYVSQGSGTFGPPMRLGTDSEVTILKLIRN